MATLLLMGSWVKEEEKESEGRGGRTVQQPPLKEERMLNTYDPHMNMHKVVLGGSHSWVGR